MDLARTDRVAHADNRIGRILEGVFRVRPQAAREDHGVSREEDLFFRRHVVCADAVRFDALDAAAGVHVDAVGAQLQLVPFDQTADQLYLYRVRLQPHPRHRL